jgi:hypothetical protein
MLKEKVLGMCSELLEEVKARLDALKLIAIGYPDLII